MDCFCRHPMNVLPLSGSAPPATQSRRASGAGRSRETPPARPKKPLRYARNEPQSFAAARYILAATPSSHKT